MLCSNDKCNQEIQDDSKYCMHCGTNIDTGKKTKNISNANSQNKLPQKGLADLHRDFSWNSGGNNHEFE